MWFQAKIHWKFTSGPSHLHLLMQLAQTQSSQVHLVLKHGYKIYF